MTAVSALLAACAAEVGVDELPGGPTDEPQLLRLSPQTPASEGVITGVLRDLEGRRLSEVFLEAVNADGERVVSPSPLGRSLVWLEPLRSRAVCVARVACTDRAGEFCFDGLRAGNYVLHLQASDRGADPTRLTATPVPIGGPWLELAVDADRAREQRSNLDPLVVEGPSGLLSVTVRSPDGRPYDMDNQVAVRDASSGEFVRWTEGYNQSPWYQARLPVGAYTVFASAEESAPVCGADRVYLLAPFGPAEVSCTISDGEVTHLDLVLFRGGRLRLALPLPRPPSDPLLARAFSAPAPTSSHAFAAALGSGSGATARLVHPEGGTIPLVFYAPEFLAYYQFESILPGTDCLSHTIVPPGLYRLEVTAPGYTARSTQVEIRADEICEVRVPLSESP